MERHFDEQLTALKHTLIKMSALSEAMISDSIQVLCKRDTSAVPRIREHEEEVNRLQIEIDGICLRLIALYQPTAGDLRFILGAVKTNGDLERMADLAINICDKAERLLEEPPLAPLATSLPDMAALASQMVKESLHAYVNRAADKARIVLLRDDQLDDMNRRITTDLLALMQKDSGMIKRALNLLLIARNLERIGDHATNIAENAIFVVKGLDVRHHHE
ncbi:MAG: phosphate signaling complex protein PhoU [Kiritimatiellaceae bacterium]|nr:phosphate signaling complex protein PhoU [Kiritimatiellaceae bacterium]